MSSGKKFFVLVIVLLGVIIGLSIWLGRQGEQKAVEPGAQPGQPTTGDAPKPRNATPASHPITPKPTAAATNPATSAQFATGTTTVPAAGLITNWNEKIDDALKSGAEDRDTAKSLLKLFPKFPAEGQVEAVQHISNLLPDEDYPELGKLMEDATLPEDVLDELIMDLLNRPNKIMLPELVKVAKNPQHAKAGEAKDFLELYLEEDYGSDWNLWGTKVDEWLKANPD